jgi:hypothetical protein
MSMTNKQLEELDERLGLQFWQVAAMDRFLSELPDEQRQYVFSVARACRGMSEGEVNTYLEKLDRAFDEFEAKARAAGSSPDPSGEKPS